MKRKRTWSGFFGAPGIDLPDREQPPLPDRPKEEIFEGAAKGLGKHPLINDMVRHGKAAIRLYLRLFAGVVVGPIREWRRAVAAFDEEIHQQRSNHRTGHGEQ